MQDLNIDTNPKVDYNLNYNSKDLYEMWMDCINDLKWTIHNSEYTRYAAHQKPSIIDHVLSNCPNKLSSVKTNRNVTSDHCILTFDYNSKGNQLKPRFRWSRNNQNLTKSNLINEVENSVPLQTIFEHTDPNIVAEILHNELNLIINKLAPKKRVQVKNDIPYLDKQTREKKKSVEKLLTKAINTCKTDQIIYQND